MPYSSSSYNFGTPDKHVQRSDIESGVHGTFPSHGQTRPDSDDGPAWSGFDSGHGHLPAVPPSMPGAMCGCGHRCFRALYRAVPGLRNTTCSGKRLSDRLPTPSVQLTPSLGLIPIGPEPSPQAWHPAPTICAGSSTVQTAWQNSTKETIPRTLAALAVRGHAADECLYAHW